VGKLCHVTPLTSVYLQLYHLYGHKIESNPSSQPALTRVPSTSGCQREGEAETRQQLLVSGCCLYLGHQ